MSTNIIPLKSGGAIQAIVPQTIEEVFRLAQGIAASGLAPRGMDKAEQITVAIMTGLEIGLPPMFAIQKIAVINGRPSIWGDAVPALLWARGFKLREWMTGATGNNRTAFCEVTRPDGTQIERVFSEADALKAGLLKKPGPWTQYPDRMLQMRARGFACRDGAADAISGLYLAEELDQPVRDVPAGHRAERMKDITPALEIPDDIPDAAAGAEQSDQIADPDGFLEKLEEDIALCTSDEELCEIAESNADMIARLPKSQKAKAEKMLKDAAE